MSNSWLRIKRNSILCVRQWSFYFVEIVATITKAANTHFAASAARIMWFPVIEHLLIGNYLLKKASRQKVPSMTKENFKYGNTFAARCGKLCETAIVSASMRCVCRFIRCQLRRRTPVTS